jgi:hypothetical protein
MIDFSFLSPVQDRIVDQIEQLHGQAIGKKLMIHSSNNERIRSANESTYKFISK